MCFSTIEWEFVSSSVSLASSSTFTSMVCLGIEVTGGIAVHKSCLGVDSGGASILFFFLFHPGFFPIPF